MTAPSGTTVLDLDDLGHPLSGGSLEVHKRKTAGTDRGDIEQPPDHREVADEEITHHDACVIWTFEGPELYKHERDKSDE